MLQAIGDMGISLVLSAVGSACGAGVAGMSAIGAWKKAYALNKAAPFIMVAFVGAPLSQTVYGMIIRGAIKSANFPPEAQWQVFMLGAFAGFANGLSAYFQGACGAKASDALGETGKGFAQYMMVLGICETVALFVMAFTLIALPK
jgi:V/A-type H+/Na+-transporting ATPase subunit K